MRKCEFKKRYAPEMGRYVRKHIYDERQIYGEGIMDVVRSIGSRVFEKTMKGIAKKAATKVGATMAEKTGQHLGNMAGDKIVQLLSKGKQPITHQSTISQSPSQPLTNFEIAERVNQLLSRGGKIKKMKIV